MKYLLVFLSIILAVIGYYYLKPMMHSSENKYKVVMNGRSTMKLWFKHWNWPYPLRVKTTYRDWPIRYEEHSTKDMYFTFNRMPGPIKRNSNEPYGTSMLKSFENSIDDRGYDAAFYKFCFVDFKMKNNDIDNRFKQLSNTVLKAHEITKRNDMKLIVGNALPMLDSKKTVVALQFKFNKWLNEYAESKQDIVVVDLYSPLVDEAGILKAEYSRGSDDTHLNDKAFSLLDNQLYAAIIELRQK